MLKTLWAWTWRILLILPCFLVVAIVALKWLPPAYTPLMMWRLMEAPFDKYEGGLEYHWVPMSEISPFVQRGVITSEDRAFLRHEGVDWRAVNHARQVNPGRVKRGKQPLGASTITMQTSRSVFLPPSRTMIRKAFEVGITYAIEWVWGKRRILEMYLNVVEWGDGVFGIEAASQHYFGKHASDLTKQEAALLVAILPNPRRFSASNPSPYIRKRAAAISAGIGGVALPRQDAESSPPKGNRRARKK